MGTKWSEWKVVETEAWVHSCWFWLRCSYHRSVLVSLNFSSSKEIECISLFMYLSIGGYYGSGRRGGEVCLPSFFLIFFLLYTVYLGKRKYWNDFLVQWWRCWTATRRKMLQDRIVSSASFLGSCLLCDLNALAFRIRIFLQTAGGSILVGSSRASCF